ncbi:MAG: hypothetical protein IJT34_10125 [Butyrivibrio sp.]|nr:hypothetical protein [Butyrivibrio sp.]
MIWEKNYHFDVEAPYCASHSYTAERGYGLVDPAHVPGATLAEQALHAGAWNVRPGAPALAEILSGQHDRCVVVFRADLPKPGRYEVRVRLAAAEGAAACFRLYSGRRNLLETDRRLESGEVWERVFYYSAAPYIPALSSKRWEETPLFVSLIGQSVRLVEMTVRELTPEEHIPVIWVAGDSTLTDQNAAYPWYASYSCAGWAQLLQVMAAGGAGFALNNQAHSGMTTNCFRDDGHWDIVREYARPGDVLLIQFGHNDQKRRNLSAFGGYRNNLRMYAERAKSMGLFPVFVTPISRVPMQDERGFHSLLSEYALAVRHTAAELGIPCVDLHGMTFDLLSERLRQGKSCADFYMPGDITHTNEAGALCIAELFRREVIRQQIRPLDMLFAHEQVACIVPVADDGIQWTELKEPVGPGMFDIDPPYVDIEGIPEYDDMVLALRYGLLDPCVLHLHPLDTMPRSQSLMVLFKALRLSGVRPYREQFCDVGSYEWDAGFVQGAAEAHLIDPATTPDPERFRPDDALTVEEMASFLIRGMTEDRDARDALTLGTCLQQAVDQKLLPERLRSTPDEPVSRAVFYQAMVRAVEWLGTQEKEMPEGMELHPVR